MTAPKTVRVPGAWMGGWIWEPTVRQLLDRTRLSRPADDEPWTRHWTCSRACQGVQTRAG